MDGPGGAPGHLLTTSEWTALRGRPGAWPPGQMWARCPQASSGLRTAWAQQAGRQAPGAVQAGAGARWAGRRAVRCRRWGGLAEDEREMGWGRERRREGEGERREEQPAVPHLPKQLSGKHAQQGDHKHGTNTTPTQPCSRPLPAGIQNPEPPGSPSEQAEAGGGGGLQVRMPRPRPRRPQGPVPWSFLRFSFQAPGGPGAAVQPPRGQSPGQRGELPAGGTEAPGQGGGAREAFRNHSLGCRDLRAELSGLGGRGQLLRGALWH